MAQTIDVITKYLEKNPPAYSDIQGINEYIIASTENLQIQDTKTKIPAVAALINACMKSEKYFDSDPYINTKDLTEIRFIIVNRLSGDTILNTTRDLYTKKGWKFDFSTGAFYNTLFSESYYLETNNGVQEIKKENKEKYDIAVGALAHYTYRVASCFKIGPALGIAVSPMDSKTRYLGGITIVLFKKNQLCINFGYAIGQTKVLSNAVSDNHVDPKSVLPAGLTAVPTIDKYNKGLYFGLTFNLTSKKE